jgi:hypothetical protein
MDDLVKRLRSGLDNCDRDSDGLELGGVVMTMQEAADRIAELEKERDADRREYQKAMEVVAQLEDDEAARRKTVRAM